MRTVVIRRPWEFPNCACKGGSKGGIFGLEHSTTLYIADNFILFTLTSPVGRLIASVIADGPKLDYYLPSLILRTILYHVGSQNVE